jgi:hypothetical protein
MCHGMWRSNKGFPPKCRRYEGWHCWSSVGDWLLPRGKNMYSSRTDRYSNTSFRSTISYCTVDPTPYKPTREVQKGEAASTCVLSAQRSGLTKLSITQTLLSALLEQMGAASASFPTRHDVRQCLPARSKASCTSQTLQDHRWRDH